MEISSRRWVMLCLALGLCLLGQAAWAQQASERGVARLNPQQIEQLNQAVDLAREERFPEALAIYDDLVSALDMDLLHLNRGRVLQKLGRCQDAAAAYGRVSTALRDPNIDLKTIQSSLRRYTEELEGQCPGTLQVQCAFPGTLVRVDQEKARPCGQRPWTVPPGEHELVATLAGQEIRQPVQVRGARSQEVRVELTRPQMMAAGRFMLGQRDFSAATTFLEAALRARDAQDAYLYLAEALLGQQQCQPAALALEQAPQALPSSQLSPVEFARRRQDLQQLLADTCGQQVLITCQPDQLTLRIDGGTPRVCSPAPIFLKAGEHSIKATRYRGPDQEPRVLTQVVQVQPGQLNQVQMDLSDEDEISPLTLWGAGGLGAGALMLGSALLVDVALLQPALDEYQRDNLRYRDAAALRNSRDRVEALQVTNQVLLIGGGLLLTTGGALLAWDLLLGEEEPPGDSARARLGVELGPEAGLLFLQGEW